MVTLNDLPTELIYMIISEVARLSYRDRARVACVSKECLRIADSPVSYKAQYIRDFGHPPQKIVHVPFTIPLEKCHTSAGPGLQPPNRWTALRGEPRYDGQETSWKRAYIRRHNNLFPQDLYASLPVVPYNAKHRDIEYKYQRMACDLKGDPKGARVLYLYGLRGHSLLQGSVLSVYAMLHNTRRTVEKQLALRGWMLSYGSLDFITSGEIDWSNLPACRCGTHFSRARHNPILITNKSRQAQLRRADIGARSGMAQVPIEFEADL